jgi:hypothetical protein
VRNNHINPFLVECSLTTLCLQYLTFPAFQEDTTDDEMQDLILEGQLAFHEYAIVNGLVHFLELAKAASDYIVALGSAVKDHLRPLSHSHPSEVAELQSAFEDFAELHALEGQELKDAELAKAAKECLAFAESDYYTEMQRLWTVGRLHADAALDIRNKPCFPSLETALERARKMIEKMSTKTKSPKDQLDQYYGETRFKCPKLTCHWFHAGFLTEKARKDHVARHERPFRCEVTDCSAEDIGFKTNKQLEKHVRMFHPSIEEIAETFKPLKAAPTKTPFVCTMPGCDRRFTRKFHLTSHIRNHNQERPFACNQCGREFTRSNDCRRHERTIHSKRG